MVKNKRMPSKGQKDCRLSIGKVQSNIEDSYIGMDIELPSQRIRLKLSAAEFGLAITGMSEVPVAVEINRIIKKVGL